MAQTTQSFGTEVKPMPVVTYWALIRVQLEESGLQFNPSFSVDNLTVIVTKKPEFVRDPWPTKVPQNQSDLTFYALSMFKALFDFGPDLPVGSSTQILAATMSKFPSITSSISSATRYAFHKVTSVITDDSRASWTLQCPSGAGADLPELPFVLEGGDLERYIQNLVRADLSRRLEELRDH
jgi:hypothetical protein